MLPMVEELLASAQTAMVEADALSA